MDHASEALFALKPVTFRYKKEVDPQRIPQFGLVAEEVEKVNPDLVVRDREGKAYSVRYDQVNAMLLNEFLKEHKAFIEEQRKVQEQGATIAELKSGLKTLAATVNKQESQLQKVSVQVELNKPTPRTVADK
jgi:septal ring factor EnvC (AmiA/AmiB activator)